MEGHPLTEKDLFLAALEIQARDAQRAFLDEACGEDRALRQEVQALLDAHERLPLEEASGEGKEPAHESVGGVIGSYKLLERIAEGGMAVDAELDDPPNQLDNWKASSTTATTTSAAAAMTLLRFSAPSFTTSTSNKSRYESPA